MTVSELKARMQELGLRPPRAATLAVTQACNLACGHCWPESGPGAGAPVPRGTLEALVCGFAELGAEEVCLTGGEPLTHPEWLGLVATAGREPGIQRVGLQTNGTLLTPASASALASLGLDGLRLQVSLEGAQPETHDRVRGAGSFAAVLAGLRQLVEAGLGPQTWVAFTELRHNLEELPELLALAEALGVAGVTSAPVVARGRARGSALGPPEPEQYRSLLARYRTDPLLRSRCDRLGRITALAWWQGRGTPRVETGCTFLEHPYVSADGRVYPCVFFQASPWAAPGALERPLCDVLAGVLEPWSELQALSRRRGRQVEACRACPGREPCAGGCLGRAWEAHGAVLAPEDRCRLRRSVYDWEP